MKIAHINNTAGVASTIARQQNKESHNSDVFVFNKSTFRAFGGRKFNYYSPISRWKFFKAINEFELWHYHHPYGTLKKSLEKRKGDRLYIKHYHGFELRQTPDHDFCLVSTPDLLKYAPNGKWLPNPIDMDLIKSIPACDFTQNLEKIRIGYYPIVYQKNICSLEQKSTESTLMKLESSSSCILSSIIGFSIVDALFEISKCDIIVGKILPTIGWIGRFELEAMALGKAVTAYVSDELYEKYRPPVHRTTPETLKQDLEYLIEESDYRERLAKSGLVYATKYHSPENITIQLDNLYKKLS